MKKVKVICLFVSTLLAAGLFVLEPARGASSAAAPTSKVISFATKPTGTVLYFIASGMTAIFNKYSGYNVTIEIVTGSKQWGPLMERGQVELAMDNAVDTGGAYRATGLFKVGDKKLTDVRLLAAGHTNLITFWTRADSPIKTIEDFAGKKIVVDAPPGAPTNAAIYNNVVDDFYKMKGKYRPLSLASPVECLNAMIEGRIDAYQMVWGTHVEELNRTVGARAIPISKEAAAYVGKKVPGILPGMIPKGTYGLKEETPCLGWLNILVAKENMDPQVVYKLLDTIYSHLNELDPVHPQAKYWVLENATKNPTVPFHTGAIMFYKDKGLWTPELDKLQQQFLEEGK
jgi:uncharacterized protein